MFKVVQAVSEITDAMTNAPVAGPLQALTPTLHPAHYPIPTLKGHERFISCYSGDTTMKRIVIVGSSGSGKSTLARQLGRSLDLPVFHLDRYYWHPGWVGTPPQAWRRVVADLAAKPEWIIDGNYRETLDARLQAADTVIFLDLPRWLCAWRALKRRFQYRFRPRPDMADGCVERIFDPDFPKFMRWVWNYPQRARPAVTEQLHALEADKHVIWLRSPGEVNHFIANPRGFAARAGLPSAAAWQYSTE